ncbi:MAG: glycosyltransferase [Chloroflexia bacterium]
MRVLHLPSNFASQIDTLVRALRDLGIEARGIVRNNAPIQSGLGVENYIVLSRKRHPVRGTIQTLFWWSAVRQAIRWADVIHWHSSQRIFPFDLELKYIARHRKARLVEFWGSDIRIPEVATQDNPYLARLLSVSDYRYGISAAASRSVQTRFSRHGFACVVPGPEMPAYVFPDLFPTCYRSEAALVMADFSPRYPDPQKRRPLVVHMPSNPLLKGTPEVLRIVEQLRARYLFDFRLIHNVPHGEALAMMRESDIVLDQFIIGSFGSVSLEAMALGKPVLCYIRPSLVSLLPSECPIVNANLDNLAEVLAGLLGDGARRQELGRQGRAYVEQHHDARQVARRLVGIYQELLGKATTCL